MDLYCMLTWCTFHWFEFCVIMYWSHTHPWMHSSLTPVVSMVNCELCSSGDENLNFIIASIIGNYTVYNYTWNDNESYAYAVYWHIVVLMTMWIWRNIILKNWVLYKYTLSSKLVLNLRIISKGELFFMPCWSRLLN